MTKTNEQISEQFSAGDFAGCYEDFKEDIVWEIIGREAVSGRGAVIDFCEKITIEMGSSKLVNTNTVSAGNRVCVEGGCVFTNDDGTEGRVRYCDVYVFDSHKIARITSYCI